MKHYIVAASLVVLLSSNAQAQLTPEDKKECAGWAEMAAAVMEDRQNGVPMSQAMAIADHVMIQKIVEAAYSVERHHTQDSKKRAVEDFRDSLYLTCYKAYSNDNQAE